MKKLIILSAIAASGLFYTKTANAQISIHLGFNIPVRQPEPVVVQETPVYDDDNVPADYNDDYYYLPEVEAYYCVPRHCYYYNDGSSWVSAAYLPGAYRNYNWRTAVRYEVHAPRPYMRNDFYRSRWGGYAGDRANWGHRFDNRYTGGYAYSNRDNHGWGRGDYGRGNWGGRSNQYDNRGWNRDNHDRGNWGSNQNQNDNRGWNRDNHDRGNWGGQRSDNRNNDNRGGNNGQRFAENRGYATRQ
ncbi:hypothetical protein [Mucilaginibacter lappiensis]|uniref:YXWGXW repeat-containing protein n=1 Tax=Mucilaginibacter lappiensis TaxID=354630 RepID=A0A841JDR5_9SPHI|nr:hypothetical protein [Mucilaginibacter lappiensis]MBB6128734.1 hypothetical protein [Mucilaginibacter lappiensis]